MGAPVDFGPKPEHLTDPRGVPREEGNTEVARLAHGVPADALVDSGAACRATPPAHGLGACCANTVRLKCARHAAFRLEPPRPLAGAR